MRRNGSRPFTCSASMMPLSIASTWRARRIAHGPPSRVEVLSRSSALRNREDFLTIPCRIASIDKRSGAHRDGSRQPAATTPGRRAVPDRMLTRSRLCELHADVLDAGVLLHRVRRHVLAVAGLLEAAMRHLGRQREQVLVDPDAPEVEPRRRSSSLDRRSRRTPTTRGRSERRSPCRPPGSSDENRCIVTTGPKTSLWTISASCSHVGDDVGLTK